MSLDRQPGSIWCASALGGWTLVFHAQNRTEAERIARGRASSASLLPSDVREVHPATDDERKWYEAMGGLH